MQIDYLAIVAHPDDAELTCSGLLMRAGEQGATIGVADLTCGEMGSRGDLETRGREAAAATAVMQLDFRTNLGLPDSGIRYTDANVRVVAEVIRQCRPKVIVAPWWQDHHPDHEETSRLVRAAQWLAGVRKFPVEGDPWRPELTLYYMARRPFVPSLVVDITAQWPRKVQAVACYRSQLHDPADDSPDIYSSRHDFVAEWEGRHRYFGSLVGATYGEPYLCEGPVPVFAPGHLLHPGR